MADRRNSLRGRILAMVPQTAQLPRPGGLAGLRHTVGERLRQALDLPSKSELSAAVKQLDEVQERLNAVERKAEASSGEVAALRESSQSERTETRQRVKKLKKELKKERSGTKKKRKTSKGKTAIDVASPKTVKERKSKSRKAKD